MKKITTIGLTAVIIAICVAMFLRNAPFIWDLQLWDETFYMATGIFNWDRHFRFYEVSPLYSYIYRIARPLTHDTATLHLWMGVIVVAVAITLTALSTLAISQNKVLAAIVTAAMLASGYSQALPKLVYVAIAIMSVGFAASTLLPRFHSKMACIALTAFIITFIRPEFVIAFYTSAAASVIALAGNYKTVLKERVWPSVTIIILAIVAALSKLWAFPVLSGGARAMQAFGQHYSLYLFNIGKIQIDPFLNYEKILSEHLPHATSEMDALRKYPESVIDYFLYNASNAAKAAASAASGIITTHPIIAASILAVAVYCLSKRQRGTFNYGNIVAWLILAAPTAISIVLIFSRDHYLVVAATLLMLLAALSTRWIGPRDTTIGAIGLLVVAAMIAPLQASEQPHFKTALALKDQKPLGALLELDGGWCYYAPATCHSVFALDIKSENIVRYLDEGHINGIIAGPTLVKWARDNNQVALASLMEEVPPGWTAIPLSKDFTLIRRDKLDMANWANVHTANIMKYVDVEHLGTDTGTVSKRDTSIIFVHPGKNDPTSLKLDPGRLARDSSCEAVSVTANLDKQVSPEAIARGGAVIGVTIYAEGGAHKSIVNHTHDMTLEFTANSSPVRISVDPHGNPDTDWLNIEMEPIKCGV